MNELALGTSIEGEWHQAYCCTAALAYCMLFVVWEVKYSGVMVGLGGVAKLVTGRGETSM